jgi:phage host-nuclease inhibitor protein Gam
MVKKIQTSTFTSFEQVDAALLELGRHTAIVQKEEAKLNEEIQKARAASDKRIADSRQRTLTLSTDIELFCNEHKDEFDKPRTRDLTHGTVGFRMTPGKVALLNRKYNWETVIELLRRVKFGARYLRQVFEVDKDKILTDATAKEITDSKLAAVGIKIQQADEFICDIKWDSIGE